MRGRAFDVYVVVDWSASSTPKLGPDSIWVHVRDATDTVAADPVNLPTRASAFGYLRDTLCAAAGRRVLVGLDMPYGYPSGFAAAAGFDDAAASPWRSTWRALVGALADGPDNANNRFEVASAWNRRVGDGPGPFWGTTSTRHVTPWLSRTKAPGFPHAGLAEHRSAELALRRRGLRPFSVWQLAGAGSVGSQTLTGIPVVHALHTDPTLGPRSRLWPFETGLTDDPAAGRADAVVHAEIWPSALGRPDPARHPVKDAGQVTALTERLAALDAAGDLAHRFAPRLDRGESRAAVGEEGWILDVT
ncbi:MAG: hypothetical protein KDB40_05865 [Acidimicrobiales bacterium]|nr:hypothetical protein [Acidimicrobiales bacterium]MCB9392143.1 hypothetical protein [Acidimicrobiaceae bacterium]